MQDLAYATRSFDSATEALKVPPHSIEAEQAVLGGLMLENSAWDQVADVVTEDDFYRRDHRLIFRAVTELSARSTPFDVITLTEQLAGINELENAGGLSYLGGLAKNTPTAANIKAYATIVRERSILRQLIRTGTEIANNAFNPEGRDSAELLDHCEKLVFEIAERGAVLRGVRQGESAREICLRQIFLRFGVGRFLFVSLFRFFDVGGHRRNVDRARHRAFRVFRCRIRRRIRRR